MATDFLGKELNIGDKVVFITPSYRDFSVGKIIKFTKCFAIIEIESTPYCHKDEIKQYFHQLIKIGE